MGLRSRVRALSAIALIASGLSILTSPPAAAASVAEVTGFGSNPGNLRMFTYVPDGLAANRPLVVVLHGTSMNHGNVDDEPGWLALADAWQFAVAFPEQKFENSLTRGFNAHLNSDNQRGVGEALSIKQMVDYMQTSHSSDPSRTFVTGFSSGGWMTNVMLSTYPDVFEGGAPDAGSPYLCTDALEQCPDAAGHTPQEWGDRIRSGDPGYGGPWPKVMVVQGTADIVASATSLNETMEGWTNVHGIDQTPDDTTPIKGYSHKVYKTSGGVTKVETLEIAGMNHSMPVDPGTGGDRCGTSGGLAATADVNLCAAYYVGTFWGLNPGSPPVQLSFANSATDDGYAVAFSNGASPSVVTDESNGLAVGHRGWYRYDRAVLSFNTAAIPDSATITRAYLRVVKQGGFGDPWSDPFGNTLKIDVKTGCFGSTCTTEAADWASAPTVAGTANLPAFPFLGDTQLSDDFGSAGRGAINRTGTTQLKLRFNWSQWFLSYAYLENGANVVLMVEYS